MKTVLICKKKYHIPHTDFPRLALKNSFVKKSHPNYPWFDKWGGELHKASFFVKC